MMVFVIVARQSIVPPTGPLLHWSTLSTAVAALALGGVMVRPAMASMSARGAIRRSL
jgi:hypothetical protein